MSIFQGCILYNEKVLVPTALQQPVLRVIHEGHPGIVAMKSIARSLVWYPNIDNDIENLVKSWPECNAIRSKPAKNNIVWTPATRVWSRVHCDHFFYENKIFLLAIDSLSKYIECEMVPSTSVNDTIDALRLIFSRHGLCDVLVSDNASCFTAYELSLIHI